MALYENTPVPTIKGWLLAKDLLVGDYVFGADGLPKPITSVQPSEAPLWTVHFSDGLGIQVDEHAALQIMGQYESFRMGARFRTAIKKNRPARKAKNPFPEMSVADLLKEDLVTSRNIMKYSVPTADPIVYKEEAHPVPPFIVGMWWKGRRIYNTLAIRPDEYEYVKEKVRAHGYACEQPAPNRIRIAPNPASQFLARYATIPAKIPEEYFLGTPEQRLELLRGIMASSGGKVYNHNTKQILYCSTNQNDLAVVQRLCDSLSIKTHVRRLYGVPYLWFRTLTPIIYNQPREGQIIRSAHRKIQRITSNPTGRCVHIEAGGIFLAGEGYIACR